MSIVSRLPPWPAFIAPLHKQVMFHLHEGEGGGCLRTRQGECLLTCRDGNARLHRYKCLVLWPLCGQRVLDETQVWLNLSTLPWRKVLFLPERQLLLDCHPYSVRPEIFSAQVMQVCKVLVPNPGFPFWILPCSIGETSEQKSGFEAGGDLHSSAQLTSVLCDLPTLARGQSSGHTALQCWGRFPSVHSRGGWVCLSAGLSWWHHELPGGQRGREEIRSRFEGAAHPELIWLTFSRSLRLCTYLCVCV